LFSEYQFTKHVKRRGSWIKHRNAATYVASHKFSEFLNAIRLEPRDQAELVLGRHMEPTWLRVAEVF
jgi:hypothetical protein